MLTVVLVTCAILIGLLVLGVGVSFALATAGLVGLFMTYHSPSQFDQLPSIAISQLNFITSALPLYVLFGELFLFAGAGRATFRAADAWLRRVPGAIGVVVVTTSAVTAAVTGATTASINTFGPTAMREAQAIGYSRSKTIGAIAAAGTLGILIPPSMPMIFYSSVTAVSLGDLFTAGFIPGVLLALVMIAYLVISGLVERRRVEAQDVGPAVASPEPGASAAQPARHQELVVHRLQASSLETLHVSASGAIAVPVPARAARPDDAPGRLSLTLGALPAMLGIVIVLGSIYSGFATPTEAAGVGGAYALLLAIIELRRGNFAEFKQALARTASTSSMMMFLLISAAIFSQVLIIQGVPQKILVAASHAHMNRWGMLVLIMLALAAVGLVINPGPTILITMPIVYPLVRQLGFDGVWFGVMLVIKLELASLTPPIGINLYVTKLVAGARFGEVMKAVVPYWWMLVGALVVLAVFPQLALWLVSVLPNGH